jgi:hypothetical protein
MPRLYRRPRPRPVSARGTTSTAPPPPVRRCTSVPSSPRNSAQPIIMHDFLTGGFSANTGAGQLVPQERDAAAHPPCHARGDRPSTPSTVSTSECWPSACACPAVTTCTPAPWWASSRATVEATLGWIDLLRESFVPEDRSRGIFFDQDWGSMPGVFAVASGGIHVWHMPALVAIFGDDSCCSSVVAPSVTPGVTQPAPLPTVSRSRPASRPATPVARSSAKARRS